MRSYLLEYSKDLDRGPPEELVDHESPGTKEIYEAMGSSASSGQSPNSSCNEKGYSNNLSFVRRDDHDREVQCLPAARW